MHSLLENLVDMNYFRNFAGMKEYRVIPFGGVKTNTNNTNLTNNSSNSSDSCSDLPFEIGIFSENSLLTRARVRFITMSVVALSLSRSMRL